MFRMRSFMITMRWLLRADVPVRPLTDDEVLVERDKNFRWNFTVNSLDVSIFFVGHSLLAGTTILPLFVSKLTESTWPIGLVAVLTQAGWFLPQLFTANVVERLPRKKPVVVNLGFLTERLPTLLLVLAAALAFNSPLLALILFLLLIAWREVGAGIIATAWQDLIARCFPVAWRGRFLGLNMFVGTALGAAAASLAAWLLANFAFPLNFVYIFGAAALANVVSWVFIALTREPEQPVKTPRLSNRQYLQELPQIVRSDDNFRHFLISRMLLALAGMGTGFLTIAAIHRWEVPDSAVAGYAAASLIGQTVANLLVGILADRHGHKLSLELAGLALVLTFGLAWLSPLPAWYYAVFFLLGFSTGAIIVSGILVVLEFSPEDKRPTYTGLTNTFAGLCSAIAPLVGAWLAGVSYSGLFALSAFVALLSALLLRYWVREPREVLLAPQLVPQTQIERQTIDKEDG